MKNREKNIEKMQKNVENYTFLDTKKYFYSLQKYFGCPVVSADVAASTLTVTCKPSTQKGTGLWMIGLLENNIKRYYTQKLCSCQMNYENSYNF